MRHRDKGFSLVELLVVIVILGVLATVTILVVRGISDGAKTSACATERREVDTAEEAYNAVYGAYATEAQLVSGGLLKSQSSYYDITLGVNTYSLVTVGDCDATGATLASSGPTPLDAPSGVQAIPGSGSNPSPGLAFGTSSGTPVIMIGIGTGVPDRGYEAAAAAWNALVAGPAPAGYLAVVLNTAPLGNSVTSTDLDLGLLSTVKVVIFDSDVFTTDTSENASDLLGTNTQAGGATVCHAANAAGFAACLTSFGL